MRAITVCPGEPGSARVDDVDEPDASMGSVMAEAVAVGVCGTDGEIVSGRYGWPPPGRDRLILGHESLGRVIDPGPVSSFAEGDLIVGIVRHPDPVPCASCAVGEWDMCRNDRYTERGIKQIDGFMAQRWRTEPTFAVKLDPALGELGVLLEPTTVVAKAWEQVTTVGYRAFWEPHTVLVTGAGPIGLLAALLGVQRGLEVHVLDRAQDGPKPRLVRELGATYHSGRVADVGLEPDIVIECTGSGQLVLEVVCITAAGGVVCLTGIGNEAKEARTRAGELNTEIVLRNKVVVGSVNANQRHYYKAAQALARADHGWLGGLITRRVPVDELEDGIHRRHDDIKVVVDVSR